MIFLRDVLRAPARSLMTALGIAAGVALFVAITAITLDPRQQIDGVAGPYQLEVIVYERRATSPMSSRIGAPQMAALQARYGGALSPLVIGTLNEKWNAYALVLGVTPEFLHSMALTSGANFAAGSGQAMIGEIAMQKLALQPGQAVTLDGRQVRISGVFRTGSRMLDGVSFVARGGEVLALTGPSGCGKSTLLSLIGLLDQPTFGSVCVAGQNLATVRQPGSFRLQHIGFVFQFHHMVAIMTLLENVEAPLVAMGLHRGERRARASDMLAQMDLSARANFLPAKVSGGERQRAAVARALINHPSLILADEPTGNLDSRNNRLVLELLMAHARANGALVLIASHNPDVAHLADRRIALCDGRRVA